MKLPKSVCRGIVIHFALKAVSKRQWQQSEISHEVRTQLRPCYPVFISHQARALASTMTFPPKTNIKKNTR
jgi:hypothetical protein